MPEFHLKERSIRVFPGRIRMEVFGLKKNNSTKQIIEQQLARLNGIIRVNPCMDTGRVLIQFDEKKLNVRDIYSVIASIEMQVLQKEDHPCQLVAPAEASEVAVTVETLSENELSEQASWTEQMKVMPKQADQKRGKTPPLALALSVGGLVALGAKQLLMGRSSLARSPAAFQLAGAVSIISGYPFLKRGFKRFAKESKLNSDLILGSSALALALIRENVVVLAGLSLLQYLNWKRSQEIENLELPFTHSPEIRSYSEKVSKLGFVLAGATYALTRDPLRGMAVLLAANPRTVTIPAEYAWKQAEHVAVQNDVVIPKNGSLTQLTKVKGILIDDPAIFTEGSAISCDADEGDVEKIWGIAASLMKKGNHPWREEVVQKAEETQRTLRTAFNVEDEEDGITGKIHGTEVYLGSLPFMQRHGIDCSAYQFKAKRLERNGHTVQFVAKQSTKELKCLGMLVKPNDSMGSSMKKYLHGSHSGDWKLYILNNEKALNEKELLEMGMDMSLLGLEPHMQMSVISSLRSQGHEWIHMKNSASEESEFFLPTLTYGQLDRLSDTVDYARKIEQTVRQYFRITKVWNLVGTALAIPYMLAAPLINLAADGLSLLFLARAKRISEGYFRSVEKAALEVAVTSEDTSLWHTMPIHTVTSNFQVHESKGLEPLKVEALRQQYGWNQLTPKQPTPWISSFLGQFKEFTTLILLGAAGLAFFTGGMFDGLAMGAVLVANAVIGTMQERKAEKVVDALNQFQSPVCKVIRENQEIEITGVELVPGDIVHLEAGDRVPADLRIIRALNLEVNEAPLTGESLPVVKNTDVHEEDCPLSERKNMLYMGTDVTRGKAIAIVVKTGMQTEMGHLMALMKGEEKQATPLQEKVTSISKTFVKGAMFAGGIVFITGLLRGVPVTQMITTSITLAASAIPEGLPVTITIALSAGIYRMASKNALIRKLSALETLGRTTVICSDKTGTLTKNEMTVKAIATTGGAWGVTGDGYEPIGAIIPFDQGEVAVASASPVISPTEENAELKKILRISLLCNNSKLEQLEGKWSIKGDPTEGALLTLAAKAGLQINKSGQWSRCHEEPFDSYSGMMSVVCKDSERDKDCFLFSKGSVEAILRRCKSYQENGQVYELTDEKRKEIFAQTEKFASDALRVLGFAYCPIEWDGENTDLKASQLIYVGMVGMMDPPKPDVEKSIREAYQLGVMPVMITGDHPITAIAIAKQLGIWDGKRKVLTGTELSHLSDEELASEVEDVSIFARVSPEHKLRIVTAFQKRGHIVAMTGDGVNDSPAIKKANVGIAMGRTGTEVTKETADMVLKEDHFGSIVDGVKEGRTIIGNIRKAIGCLLTGNLAEVLVTSAAVIAGMPIPLVPIQILLMNLLTDALPAMILAINPGDKTKNTKRQDIVDKQLYQKVVTRGVLLGAGSLGLFALSLASGASLAVAQTTAFATLVAGQLMQTFSWRQEGKEETIRDWTRDRFLIGALGISWIALLTTIYVPPISRIFHAAPLPIASWIPILAVAGSISLISKPVLNLISGNNKIMPLPMTA